MKMKMTRVILIAIVGTLGSVSGQERAKKLDMDSVKKRIEGAVERGDLTRDQANQKYAELKKKMAFQKDRVREEGRKGAPASRPARDVAPGPEGLKRLLGEMMKQGKMDEKTAARLYAAAFGDRAPGRHHEPKHQPGPPPEEMMNEMREMMTRARQELMQIRQMRMEMERERQLEKIEKLNNQLEMKRRELEERRQLEMRRRVNPRTNPEERKPPVEGRPRYPQRPNRSPLRGEPAEEVERDRD